MTSSSNARLWQPFTPDAAAGIGTAVVGTNLPAFAPAIGELVGAWPPSLRSGAELRAEATHQALEAAAYRRGLEEGTHAERERADARCATALEAVAAVAAHLDSIAGEFARDRERDVQALAIAVARHVVQHELTIDPLRVGELVRRAIELLPNDHALEVRVHPDDLATLQPALETLVLPGRDVSLQWASDPGMERGGFVIETPHRIIDGRTDVALRTLYERLDHD